MRTLKLGNASILPTSVSFSMQNPSQQLLTDKAAIVSGEDVVTREYEVQEQALDAFIANQLAAGGIDGQAGTLVQIQGSSSGIGDVYNLTVTISSLSVPAPVPYFTIADGFIFVRHNQQ